MQVRRTGREGGSNDAPARLFAAHSSVAMFAFITGLIAFFRFVRRERPLFSSKEEPDDNKSQPYFNPAEPLKSLSLLFRHIHNDAFYCVGIYLR